MSYTPPEQIITETLERTRKDLRTLDVIALARLESGEWNESHDEKLKRLRILIAEMEMLLVKIRTGT